MDAAPAEAPEDFRFALRAGEPADLAFVADSWRRSYSDGDWTRCPGGLSEYIATQRAVIMQALATSEVLIAHPEERTEQILGWACFRRPAVVHYVYVKPFCRQLGIAWKLLTAAFGKTPPGCIYSTHGWRRPADKGRGVRALAEAAKSVGIALEYNPALIFGGT